MQLDGEDGDISIQLPLLFTCKQIQDYILIQL